MNKIGCSNYLSNDKESLIAADSDIEGRNGLPLDSNYLLMQLQIFIKSINFWRDDNVIINNVTSQIILPTNQSF